MVCTARCCRYPQAGILGCQWQLHHVLRGQQRLLQDHQGGLINAKGYSSNTNYLVWINRAYQHVNVFTGSKGNWKLTKSFIVGTGAASTPTPVGVTTVSYKLKAGWTTGTYTVRPVVGFYPGTGYAFHSRLCYPGTSTEYDFSSGYPVSHGCVRMKHNDINWIYNNVPIGSTVVIF
ncbi:MAG: L,D-transpeptidase [Butyricicoccus sp.]